LYDIVYNVIKDNKKRATKEGGSMKSRFFLFIICYISLSANDQTLDGIAHKSTPSSATTWVANGGRFGDNLLSYARAKWLSYKYDIPVLYLPFPYSDQLILHEQEDMYTPESEQLFTHITHLPPSAQYHIENDNNTLYVSYWKTDIDIDWSDTVFIEGLKQKIAPRNELKKTFIPKDRISIAVHVRNGGTFGGDHAKEKERCPLRFVSNNFFIRQVQRLADMFNQQKLFVYIFTDHPNPAKLVKKFKKRINNPNITFSYRKENNSHNANVLEDLFSMMKFDCLVRPESNFSRFVQRLGNNTITIYPESVYKRADGKTKVDAIVIEKRNNEHEPWKTAKRIVRKK
jgi:hypothetical protein